MFKKLLIAIAVLLVLFIGIVAIQPPEFRVTRSILVSAAASEVFPLVNDFHRWDAWSPWAKLDPAMKTSISGAAGTGSVYEWTGNDKVGQGRMSLVESRANELIRIKLEFIKPFASTSDTDMAFSAEGNATRVTWTMSGGLSFVEKAICLFQSMDKMIGGDFERGLGQLKSVAESAARK